MSEQDELIALQRAAVDAALDGKADDSVVLSYIAALNEHNAGLPGVPHRDLTAGELRAMPEWLQRSVFAAPFYAPAE